MATAGPTLGKMLTMVGFALSCFGLLLFLWLAFGGPIPLKPEGYRFQTSFAEATQLAEEADVRISGVPVGKVKTVEPDKKTGRSTAVMELQSAYAPLPADTKAILRQKTLLGETYVELTPGNKQGPKIPEGGTLPDAQISPTVELDEIYRSFDDRTRKAFQSWMQSQSQAIDGRGRDLNDAFGNLGPLAEDAAVLVDILNRQEGAVQKLVANTGETFEALTARGTQLRQVIENSNTVFETTAARDQELQEIFTALPTFQRETRETITRLSEFAEETDPLVTQLRPAARELSPTLGQLELLAPDLRRLFTDLGPLITASRTGLPALTKILDGSRPLFAQFDPTLRQLVPILDFVGLYKKELNTFFANTVATTQAFDITPGTEEKVHYLRTSNPLNVENLAVYPRRVGSNRPNPYMLPGDYDLLRTQGHLNVFEDDHCGRGVPLVSQVLTPILEQILGKELTDNVREFAFVATAAGQQPAPPCKKQGKFTFQGETLQYPHVKPAPATP
jgi:virulence factor Mce-like protein